MLEEGVTGPLLRQLKKHSLRKSCLGQAAATVASKAAAAGAVAEEGERGEEQEEEEGGGGNALLDKLAWLLCNLCRPKPQNLALLVRAGPP